MSELQLLQPDVLSRGITALHEDLQDGTWQHRNSALLQKAALDVGWRLLFATDLTGDR
jgi:hypothetical protein